MSEECDFCLIDLPTEKLETVDGLFCNDFCHKCFVKVNRILMKYFNCKSSEFKPMSKEDNDMTSAYHLLAERLNPQYKEKLK